MAKKTIDLTGGKKRQSHSVVRPQIQQAIEKAQAYAKIAAKRKEEISKKRNTIASIGKRTRVNGWLSQNETENVCYIYVDGVKFPFEYSPENMEFSYGATYTEVKSPQMNYPLYSFASGEGCSMSVEVFIYDWAALRTTKVYGEYTYTADTMTAGNSRIIMSQALFDALLPEQKTSGGAFASGRAVESPVSFTFVYGVYSFECYLEKYNMKIERFGRDGYPLQARVTLTLRVL